MAVGVLEPAEAAVPTPSAKPVVTSSQPFVEHQPISGYSRLLVAHYKHSDRITEQYRALRTHLLAHYTDKPFAMIVTSAEESEGKTVTCLNLGFMLGRHQEHRAVIVDADLRRGKIAKLLKQSRDPGLAEVLGGHAKLDDVIQPTVYPNVSVITAGKCRLGDAGELLARAELDQVVARLRRQFDFVLFDTPPVKIVSDACAIGRAVNDALVVVRMNKTRRETVDEAVQRLNAVRVNVIGLVLTHQKYYIPRYVYSCS